MLALPDRIPSKKNLNINQSDTIGLQRRSFGRHLDALNTPGKKSKPTLTLAPQENRSPIKFRTKKGPFRSNSKEKLEQGAVRSIRIASEHEESEAHKRKQRVLSRLKDLGCLPQEKYDAQKYERQAEWRPDTRYFESCLQDLRDQIGEQLTTQIQQQNHLFKNFLKYLKSTVPQVNESHNKSLIELEQTQRTILRLVAGLGKQTPKSMDEQQRNHYELSIAKLKAQLYKTQLGYRQLQSQMKQLQEQSIKASRPITCDATSQTQEQAKNITETAVQTEERTDVKLTMPFMSSNINSQAQPLKLNIEDTLRNSDCSLPSRQSGQISQKMSPKISKVTLGVEQSTFARNRRRSVTVHGVAEITGDRQADRRYGLQLLNLKNRGHKMSTSARQKLLKERAEIRKNSMTRLADLDVVRRTLFYKLRYFGSTFEELQNLMLEKETEKIEREQMENILREHPFFLSEPSLDLLIEVICEGKDEVSRDEFTLKMREFMGEQQEVNQQDEYLLLQKVKGSLFIHQESLIQEMGLKAKQEGEIDEVAMNDVLEKHHFSEVERHLVIGQCCLISPTVDQLRYTQYFAMLSE